jgi:hypothetical protein
VIYWSSPDRPLNTLTAKRAHAGREATPNKPDELSESDQEKTVEPAEVQGGDEADLVEMPEVDVDSSFGGVLTGFGPGDVDVSNVDVGEVDGEDEADQEDPGVSANTAARHNLRLLCLTSTAHARMEALGIQAELTSLRRDSAGRTVITSSTLAQQGRRSLIFSAADAGKMAMQEHSGYFGALWRTWVQGGFLGPVGGCRYRPGVRLQIMAAACTLFYAPNLLRAKQAATAEVTFEKLCLTMLLQHFGGVLWGAEAGKTPFDRPPPEMFESPSADALWNQLLQFRGLAAQVATKIKLTAEPADEWDQRLHAAVVQLRYSVVHGSGCGTALPPHVHVELQL